MSEVHAEPVTAGPPLWRSTAVVVLILCSLAVVVRLATVHLIDMPQRYTMDETGYLLFDGLKGDEREYEGRAWNLLQGRNFWALPNGDGNAPPGYPLFVAGVYAIVGRVPYALLVVNALLGAAATWLTFVLAQHFGRYGLSVAAAAGVAIDPQLVFWSSRATTESLAVCLTLAALLVGLWLRSTNRVVYPSLLAACVFFVSFVVRGNLIVLLVAFVIWWTMTVRGGGAKWSKLAVVLVAFFALTAPVQRVAGVHRPEGTTGMSEQMLSGDVIGPESYVRVALQRAVRQKGAVLTEVEEQRAIGEAREFIQDQPAWKVMLSAWGFKLTVFWRTIPTVGTTVQKIVYFLSSAPLFACAAAGLFLAPWSWRSERWIHVLFVLNILGLTALHCLTLVRPRYRLVLEPLLWILAVQGCAFVLRRLRGVRKSSHPSIT